jgi:hypothetical protein
VFVSPLSTVWCSDANPSPWQHWTDAEDDAGAFIKGGYATAQVHLTATLRPDISNYLVRAIAPTAAGYDAPTLVAAKMAVSPRMPLRVLLGLLATLNDLPVKIEHVIPSRGYVARGNYKRFLEHSTVTLNVPETKWRSLVTKTAALVRRRAHQVRGFWRRDWRHPLAPLCAHDFDDRMVCRQCGGHKIWVPEHQRGDASLGFVVHDFSVHANKGDRNNG